MMLCNQGQGMDTPAGTEAHHWSLLNPSAGIDRSKWSVSLAHMLLPYAAVAVAAALQVPRCPRWKLCVCCATQCTVACCYREEGRYLNSGRMNFSRLAAELSRFSTKYQVQPGGGSVKSPTGGGLEKGHSGWNGARRRGMGKYCCMARLRHWTRGKMILAAKRHKEMSIDDPLVQELVWKAGNKLALGIVLADGWFLLASSEILRGTEELQEICLLPNIWIRRGLN